MHRLTAYSCRCKCNIPHAVAHIGHNVAGTIYKFIDLPLTQGAAAAAEPRRSARAAAMRESGQVLELPWKLDAEAEPEGEE